MHNDMRFDQGIRKPRGYRFLIVEDNTAAADIMMLFFERCGYRSEAAENGQEGLEMYLRDPLRYDIIFLDLQMPVMDGYEMARRVRQSDTPTARAIPIVAMSGTNTGDVVGRGGFTHFLKKPFELRSLPGIIEEMLE